MSNYVVISYDPDEQQTFWDYVVADSQDAAGEEIAELREYATVVECLSAEALSQMAADAQNTTHEVWNRSRKELRGC